MLWTYRVFRDSQERYSIREVFYDRNNTIINYSKTPVAVVGASIEELIQFVQWFKEAFDLPVLSLEEIDAQIAAKLWKQDDTVSQARDTVSGAPRDRSKNISLIQVIAELATDSDSIVL
ncbi:MAG: hypothetical protein HC895_23550 [Leptolyngbyaceae cyanobacterium SM1_3_5]|nr:hypothetical protein [Leptolyngbyaceae cyanobacterium SM1_3_5]